MLAVADNKPLSIQETPIPCYKNTDRVPWQSVIYRKKQGLKIGLYLILLVCLPLLRSAGAWIARPSPLGSGR